MESVDAIVVGAGHNGLAAGITLAKAGWSVLVLERQGEPGGAVRTAEVTLPGFKHDLYATNLNLFAGSPFFQEFRDELVSRGLEFAASSKPFCSVFPDGDLLGVSTDLNQTLEGLRRLSTHDAEAWRAVLAEFQRVAGHLFPLLADPIPSWAMARSLWRGIRALGRQWPLELAHLLVQSPREFVESHFEHPKVHALCAAWGMHLDFAPDVAGGALFPFLECMAGQMNGMVLGKGGARALTDALVSLFRSLGGELRCSAPVESIMVERNTATGVRVQGGATIAARRAVIANLTPTVLFERLVCDHVPPHFREKVRRYRYGPGTMMIHLALSDLPDWKARAAREYMYVHIGPYLSDMGLCYHQAVSGLLPESPALVVGQPTIVDPTRAPEGRHILWVQVRVVPGEIRGDARGEIAGRDWDAAKEAYAERVLGKIEVYAPGLRERILGRSVLSPSDLERENPNLVGGDNVSGSHHLMQNFLFRPFLGWSKYRTPIDRLYMCGAATWPGAGVGAGSGRLLGRMLARR